MPSSRAFQIGFVTLLGPATKAETVSVGHQ